MKATEKAPSSKFIKKGRKTITAEQLSYLVTV
jgi:hypothetical protein